MTQWDTACNYSNGESERIIGNAIKMYSIPRHKVQILTKCFGIVAEEPDFVTGPFTKDMMHSKDYVNQRGTFSRTLVPSATFQL